MEGIDTLVQWIENSSDIVALTGAGISTSAGVPDFRGKGGLYDTLGDIADKVFDIEVFKRDPTIFYSAIGPFMESVLHAKPTKMHLLLAEIEREGKLKAVITQNVDILHQKAGSKKVIELHGSFAKGFCISCGKMFHYEEILQIKGDNIVPHCQCGGVIKPDVVFFGEPVKDIDLALHITLSSDLLLIIGSSLVVYPAAGLPAYAPEKIAVINRDKPALLPKGSLFVQGEIESIAEEITKRRK